MEAPATSSDSIRNQSGSLPACPHRCIKGRRLCSIFAFRDRLGTRPVFGNACHFNGHGPEPQRASNMCIIVHQTDLRWHCFQLGFDHGCSNAAGQLLHAQSSQRPSTTNQTCKEGLACGPFCTLVFAGKQTCTTSHAINSCKLTQP